MGGTVLMTRFSALGDVAMTVPVVYSACRCYPDRRFVMVTRKGMTGVFVNPPANLTLVGIDLAADYRGPAGMARFAARLMREYRPVVYVDLHNVLRTRLLGFFLWLRGVPAQHLEKPRRQRRALTRRRNKIKQPLMPQLERYADVFARAGLPVTEHFDGLYGGRDMADPQIFAAVTQPKAEGEVWIGIAPFAAHQGKIYPPQQMEQVVTMLQQRADEGLRLKVFLFGGGAGEVAALSRWEEKYPAATSLAGKRYGFAVELALLNHIDAMVSMDSGNMHLAAIAGAPVVSIWGATHTFCGFRAWHQADSGIVELSMDCRPCSVFGNKPCRRGDYACLRDIPPQLIYNKIAQTAQL